MSTLSEKRHLGRVAALPCALCSDLPVQVHHIRHGQGMAQRAPHWLTIPLCPDCHEQITILLGVHKTTELDLLAQTLDTLYGGTR